MSRYAAALDFGSAKVALAVGEKTPGGIRIVSYHDAPSAGIECGEIVNDFKVKEIVRSLIEQAQADLQQEIEEVTVSLSGRILHSRELPCVINRTDPKAYISEEEVRQITRARYNATLEDGEIVFEAVPQKYSTEERFGINHDELIGMVGGTLETTFRIFYGKKAIIDRRITVLDNCGLKLNKAILSPIASARAVLTRPEMENGVALVDIGKSTTEVAIVKDNTVREVAIIPFGGETVTNDIKNVTGITNQWAETIKILHGRCCEEYAVENKKIILKNENDSDDGEVELSLLARVIEARMSEIFDAVRYVIEQSGYASKLTSGVVITGGSSHLENILQLANALIGQKVRLAAPQGSIDGGSVEEAFDVYAATAVGLVLETLEPLLSHAIEFKKETTAQAAAKPADSSLFTEEDDLEEDDDRPSAREERERRREEERRAKELRKQQEAQRKREEAERKAREKAERAEKKKKEPSFFDLLFSDNDNDKA
ncbi:MAG: cell division protein FtsA [Bacteroidales bacterium]|nr:cell division protein FtsA [Bacteroidales bacterium]